MMFMVGTNAPVLPPERLLRLNSLQLAYVGDTVYDLYVRTKLLRECDGNVHTLHTRATGSVRASAQAEALARVEPMLTEGERIIVRRGRNAHTHSIPKHADPADYAKATAMEALVGYLYLSGGHERLEEIMRMALGNEEMT
jgi:ribonuclease-3 family protein